MANNSRTQLKKMYKELKFILPNLPPIQSLTDEQVIRILERIYHINLELATINTIAISRLYTIQAEEDPTEYHKLLFPSVN